MIIRITKYLLIIGVFFSVSAVNAQNLNVSNLHLKKENEVLIITYDINGSPLKKYNVSIEVVKANGQKIIPTYVDGDVGNNISGGKNKKIIWNIFQDSKEIEVWNVFVKAVDKNANKQIKSRQRHYKGSNNIAGEIFGAIGNGIASFFKDIDIIGFKLEGGLSGPTFSQKLIGTNVMSWTGSVGFFAQHTIIERINFQWEFIYTSRGYDVKDIVSEFNFGSQTYEITERKLRLGYIQMPLSFNFRVGKSVSLTAGGYISIATTGKYRLTPTASGKKEIEVFSEFPEHQNIKIPINRVDLGVFAGIYWKKKVVDLGGRFYYGLNNINNSKYWTINNPLSRQPLNHFAIVFYIGFRINI